jgi:hypothetical protein
MLRLRRGMERSLVNWSPFFSNCGQPRSTSWINHYFWPFGRECRPLSPLFDWVLVTAPLKSRSVFYLFQGRLLQLMSTPYARRSITIVTNSEPFSKPLHCKCHPLWFKLVSFLILLFRPCDDLHWLPLYLDIEIIQYICLLQGCTVLFRFKH